MELSVAVAATLEVSVAIVVADEADFEELPVCSTGTAVVTADPLMVVTMSASVGAAEVLDEEVEAAIRVSVKPGQDVQEEAFCTLSLVQRPRRHGIEKDS